MVSMVHQCELGFAAVVCDNEDARFVALCALDYATRACVVDSFFARLLADAATPQRPCQRSFAAPRLATKVHMQPASR